MKNNIAIPVSYLKDPRHFLSLGFGSGLMPKAPGTFGTLAAIPIYMLMSQLSPVYYLLITAVITLLGIYVAGYTTQALGVHDHSGIVIDEIAGYLITMMMVPYSWVWILTGFVLFRVFDILKPWPISWLDRKVEGGFGIMIDDVLAGFLALICLHVIISLT